MKATIALYALCLLLIAGCKKDNQSEQNIPDNGLANKINSWLAAQQHTNTPERNQKIQSLSQYLDYARAYFEDLNNGEKFIIVPVKAGFKTVNNKNTNPLNVLILTLDKIGKIRDGKIIQFVPESGTTPERLPQNTIHNIFNSQPVTAAGSFTALAIWDQYMFRLDYKNGNLASSKMMEPEGGYARYNTTHTTGCTDWFIVTTLYVNGVMFDQIYEYVGTTCNGCTPQDPNAESIGCEGNGDGDPGGAPVPEPEPVSKQVHWVVKADAALGWHVDSWEFLQGAKPAPPLVPYFTAITHINDDIINPVPSTDSRYSAWHKLAITTGVTGAQSSCQSTVAGKVTCSIREDVPVSNAKGWLAVTEFP